MTVRTQIELEPGVHTVYEIDGVIVAECEETPEVVQLERAIAADSNSPAGMLRGVDGRVCRVELRRTERPKAYQHRTCQTRPRGGSQIAPAGAGWVGTLGGACSFVVDGRRLFGAITNWHVANGGRYGLGAPICQPDGRARPFGRQAAFEPIEINQQASNVMDVSLIDCEIDGFHWVDPEMIGLGRLSGRTVDPSRGMRVRKTGRTTGVQTNGEVTATGVTTFVDYGSGVARFVDQIQIRNRSGGEFSAGGDSGSLIVDGSGNVVALLFAGSPGVTIASPIAPIVRRFEIRFDL